MSDQSIIPFAKEVKDLRGHKYGMLTVLEYAGTDKKHRSLWRCKCDCGNEVVALGSTMRLGHRKCCGCQTGNWISKARTTHGKTRSREFRIWSGIKERTGNPKCKEYPRYGARGIKMCDRWKASFELFLQDMGTAPTDDHSIDRINNDGDYCPENCRWATRLEQAANKSNTVFCLCNGFRVHLAEAARMLGKHHRHTYRLVSHGLVELCQ